MRSVHAVISSRGSVVFGRVYRTKRKADAALKALAVSTKTPMYLAKRLGWRVVKYVVVP